MALEAARRAVQADLERREALRAEPAVGEAVTAEPVLPEQVGAEAPPVGEPAAELAVPAPPPLGELAAPGPAAPPALSPDLLPALDRALAELAGARLCFGDAIEAHGRTVVPVARVRAAGGIGVRPRGGAPGGGGRVDSRPVGALELGPDGVRFTRLPATRADALRTGAATAAFLAAIAAVLRLLRR